MTTSGTCTAGLMPLGYGGLMLLSFTAVYREGFEVVLIYTALWY